MQRVKVVSRSDELRKQQIDGGQKPIVSDGDGREGEATIPTFAARPVSYSSNQSHFGVSAEN